VIFYYYKKVEAESVSWPYFCFCPDQPYIETGKAGRSPAFSRANPVTPDGDRRAFGLVLGRARRTAGEDPQFLERNDHV